MDMNRPSQAQSVISLEFFDDVEHFMSVNFRVLKDNARGKNKNTQIIEWHIAKY